MRPLTVLRALLGSALLLAPGTVLADLPHQRIDGLARLFARVLGVRHLVQAAVAERHPGHAWTVAGAAVDATHAATMVVLAVARPDRRRLAATNATVALALAGDGLCEARRSPTRGQAARGCG